MSKALVVLLLVVLSSALVSATETRFPFKGHNGNNNTPKFCHGLDCPTYTTYFTNATAGVEYRAYPAALWARTNVSTTSFDVASNEGFHRLFNYISGENVGNVTIPMTAPVSIQVFPGQGPFCKSTFIVSFFVPFAYQDASNPPPRPTNPDVYVELLPASNKAVYSFGGFTWTWKEVLPPIETLDQFLIQQGQPFVPNIEYVCGYDAPFRPIDRHNEIWVDLL